MFYFIFVWKRLIRGSGKPGKLREFNFAEFVSTLVCLSVSMSVCVCVCLSRLQVRENGRQKVCVSGLMENEVQDLNALVRVSKQL